ncbi:hypothetical protein BH09SUM1_BH09SUM1_31610 [soil metagenome]
MCFSFGGGTAEVPPAATLPCFPGAYYRKAVSSTDHWTGIEAVVILPRMEFDDARLNPTSGRPLDNPSIYIGGKAGQEIDAGLSWEVIREADGTISPIGKAFRPFWRNAGWKNAPAEPAYYYYPGDKVYLRCEAKTAGKLEIETVVLERGACARKELKALGVNPDDPATTMTATFDASGFGPGKNQEFKRVDGIDQVHNEGKPVVPTKTRVSGAEWVYVNLIRDGERIPMTPARFTDMRCPDPSHVVVTTTAEQAAKGGEKVDLIGTPP